MKHRTQYVTWGKWSVGGMTPPMSGGSGTELHARRWMRGMDYSKTIPSGHDGQVFPSWDAADAFAVAQGYLQPYFHRPNGFIDLRLSPATRRYLRGKSEQEVWQLLARILGSKNRPGDYFYDVRVKDFMAETRTRWMATLKPGGTRRPATQQENFSNQGLDEHMNARP